MFLSICRSCSLPAAWVSKCSRRPRCPACGVHACPLWSAAGSLLLDGPAHAAAAAAAAALDGTHRADARLEADAREQNLSLSSIETTLASAAGVDADADDTEGVLPRQQTPEMTGWDKVGAAFSRSDALSPGHTVGMLSACGHGFKSVAEECEESCWSCMVHPDIKRKASRFLLNERPCHCPLLLLPSALQLQDYPCSPSCSLRPPLARVRLKGLRRGGKHVCPRARSSRAVSSDK